MKKIQVLIVEDSAVVRQYLEYIIGNDPRLEVAASVDTAERAIEILDRVAPDVISLDIRLPGMNGFEATRRIMSERPTPIVLVSASVNPEDLTFTMQALQAGALAAVEKPGAPTQEGYEQLAQRMCTQLAIMSQVKTVRQWRRPEPVRRREPLPAAAPRPVRPDSAPRVLGIAASTGGPSALAELLPKLGPDFPLPILLVQHISPGFLEGFCDWLAKASRLKTRIVSDRTPLETGVIHLAARDRHLVINGATVNAEPGEPVSAHRPSATVLFLSMARSAGDRAIGVLLTGMGDDGAEGLLQLRAAGGYTIAEDESTAVVYGMPRAAARAGAVCESLPLPAISGRILELLACRVEAQHE